MAAIGAARTSMKVGPWRGMTLIAKSDPGRFLLLENGYVNSDGSEIRMMPGMKCVIDPETRQRALNADTTLGYRCTVVDARRNPYASLAANTYYSIDNAAPVEQMLIWSNPGLPHCAEQVHGRWLIVCENDHRREPIYNAGRTAFVHMIEYEDDGVNITITLNEAPDATAATFNAVVDNDRVTIDGATGALAAILNGKNHRLTGPPAGATITVATTSGGVVAAVTGQTAYISRVGFNARNPAGASDDTFSDMAVYTSLDRGDDTAAPTELVRPSHFAPRMRDFGDSPLSRKEGNNNAATANGGTSRRRRIGIPYRVVPHVASDRLIMAAPGYGCVWQAPVIIPPSFTTTDSFDGIGSLCNDVYDRPRALGLPKAVVWEDPDKAVATSYHIWAAPVPGPGVPDRTFGGPAAPTRAGTYKFIFAYSDEATGEVGLCSEPIAVTTDAAAGARQGIRFWIYFPGYLMHETLATTINVYRTKRNGNEFFYDRTVPMTMASMSGFSATTTAKYGLIPEAATTEFYHHVLYEALYVDDVTLSKQLNPVPRVLEQMPMGCKAARTIRGFTLFGGALGDSGSRKELIKGSTTFEYGDTAATVANDIYPHHDEVTFMFTNSVTPNIAGSYDGAESWLFTGARRIPPAYSGQSLVGKSVVPYPRKRLTLNKQVNTTVSYTAGTPLAYTGRIPDVRFEVVDTPIPATEDIFDATRRAVTSYLKLPRARIQISEPDTPSVVPATNTTVLANEVDDDIEAIGDAGGQAIICTQAKTYVLGFSQSPIGATPEVARERFGCIAANSMVSFDGGCAWISDRGPVAFMGGAIQWIGQPLLPLFVGESAVYQRDGDGMMRHAWACHDAERNLLYFGVFSNRNAGTSLEVKINYNNSVLGWEGFRGTPSQDLAWSKFPCDEVLVFSYMTGAWSVWKPPQPIQWMTRGVDKYGVMRVFLLGADRRLYVLDDNWSQMEREPWSFTAAANETIAGFTSSIAHTPSWLGLSVTVTRTTDGVKSIVGIATITGETISGVNTTVTLSNSITTKVGDSVVIGLRSMRLQTTFINVKKSDTAMSPAAGISYAMDSRADVGGAGPYDAFISGRAVTSKIIDGIPVRGDESLNNDDPQNYTWLGGHSVNDPVRDKKVAQGLATGQNHMFDIRIIGSAQVRLQDLFVEVA